MKKNIKVFRAHRALSWLYIVMLCLMILAAVMVPREGMGIQEIIGMIVVLGSFFLIHHFVAKGAREKKTWAQYSSALIAALMLFGFPIGTLIGIYLLVNNFGWDEMA